MDDTPMEDKANENRLPALRMRVEYARHPRVGDHVEISMKRERLYEVLEVDRIKRTALIRYKDKQKYLLFYCVEVSTDAQEIPVHVPEAGPDYDTGGSAA